MARLASRQTREEGKLRSSHSTETYIDTYIHTCIHTCYTLLRQTQAELDFSDIDLFPTTTTRIFPSPFFHPPLLYNCTCFIFVPFSSPTTHQSPNRSLCVHFYLYLSSVVCFFSFSLSNFFSDSPISLSIFIQSLIPSTRSSPPPPPPVSLIPVEPRSTRAFQTR